MTRISAGAKPPSFLEEATASHRQRLVFLAIIAAAVALAMLLLGQVGALATESTIDEAGSGVSGNLSEGSRAQASSSCVGKRVRPGDDLDRVVNGDPRSVATTFCLASGTYVLSSAITLDSGDSLVGPVGRKVTKGPSTYGVPTAKITDGAARLSRLITLGPGARRVEWVELYGAHGEYTNETRAQCANWGDVANRCPKAGTGVAIGAGQAGGRTLMRYLYVHGNDSLGIGSATGRVLNSHFTDNTRNPDWLGFEGSAIKGITEFEAAGNFIHGEQGNGIWCDVGCDHESSLQKGFWVRNNLVVNNGRWGIRFENSRASRYVTSLIEGNRLHGNGRERAHTGGGISMHDAQNGTFRSNRFGPATIGGVRYRGNVGGLAVQFADSNRADRTNLRNGKAVSNYLRGEAISGCSKPNNIVYCANNAR